MSDHGAWLGKAFRRLDVPSDVRALIVERHSEPHRHYHILRHIDLMLAQISADHPFAPEMIAATLFHDIVYDPARSDNEDLSLSTFLSVANTLARDVPVDAQLVSAMILATKSHRFRAEHTAEDAAVNLLLKADLSILWHPDPAVYRWYASGVRQEYGFVPEHPFREARTRILTTLRDDLLRSDRLTLEEAQALRRNTAWELQSDRVNRNR